MVGFVIGYELQSDEPLAYTKTKILPFPSRNTLLDLQLTS